MNHPFSDIYGFAIPPGTTRLADHACIEDQARSASRLTGSALPWSGNI
jgi:hypothetical protein